MMNKLLEWDRELFLFLNSKHLKFLDPFMLFVSSDACWILGGLTMLTVLYLKGGIWKTIAPLFFILSVSLSAAITNLVKIIIKRPRPIHNEVWDNVIHAIEEYESSYSFFSSHSATTFSMAVFFFLFFRKSHKIYGIIALIWAAIVSYSRIYLAKHYPLDVLVGVTIGSLIAICCYKLMLFYQKKKNSSN